MKYFVLLAGYGELPSWVELTAEEQEAQKAQLGAFDEACAARPGVEILSQAPLGMARWPRRCALGAAK
jgi:hypothetical protein